MERVQKQLITQLAGDLAPVRPMRLTRGLLWLGIATALTVLGVVLVEGLRPALFSGQTSPLFVVTNGLLLVLGFAAATSTIAMASPRVGNRHDAPRWAMAMAGVMPVAALATIMLGAGGLGRLVDPHGLSCFASGSVAGLLSAGVLFAWLKRGAPVSLTAAGTHLGVAAGALGSAAYGISCPIDGVVHLGVWHFLPVLFCGLAGRLVLPRLLSW